jgi:omega-6 fatty acid desaturase (delta-12 desaturase)
MLQIVFNHVVNNGLIYLLWNYLQTHGILIHYTLSLLLSFIINFLLFFNQHTFNPAYAVDDSQWSQRNSGLEGSSFIQMPSLLKYYSGGIEYHHIHHMNSKIPGYNIEMFHNEVELNSNMFANITRLSMRDCYNNLWLMLYDEDNKKYITMQQANARLIKND